MRSCPLSVGTETSESDTDVRAPNVTGLSERMSSRWYMRPQVTHQHSRRQWTCWEESSCPTCACKNLTSCCLISPVSLKPTQNLQKQELQFFTPQQDKRASSFESGILVLMFKLALFLQNGSGPENPILFKRGSTELRKLGCAFVQSNSQHCLKAKASGGRSRPVKALAHVTSADLVSYVPQGSCVRECVWSI